MTSLAVAAVVLGASTAPADAAYAAWKRGTYGSSQASGSEYCARRAYGREVKLRDLTLHAIGDEYRNRVTLTTYMVDNRGGSHVMSHGAWFVYRGSPIRIGGYKAWRRMGDAEGARWVQVVTWYSASGRQLRGAVGWGAYFPAYRTYYSDGTYTYSDYYPASYAC